MLMQKTLEAYVDALCLFCLERAKQVHATRPIRPVIQDRLRSILDRYSVGHYVPRTIVSIRGKGVPNKSRRRRAKVFLRSLISVHLLCGWDTVGSSNYYFRWYANRAAIALFGSEEAYYPQIKAACVRARLLSLQGATANWRDSTLGVIVPHGIDCNKGQLYELSRLSRALPAPTKVVLDKKEVAFLDACSQAPEESPVFDSRYSRFLEEAQKCLKWYRAMVTKGRGKAGYDVVGSSACLEYKASEGGRLMDFLNKEPINPRLPTPQRPPGSPPVRLSLAERQKKATQRVTSKSVRHAHFEMGGGRASLFDTPYHDEKSFTMQLMPTEPPGTVGTGAFRTGRKNWMLPGQIRFKRSKSNYLRLPRPPEVAMTTCALPERGWKVRVITRSPGLVVAKNHQVRRVLYKQLQRIRGVRESLMGPPLRLPVKSGGAKRKVYSADMSGATDTLRHDTLDLLASFAGVDPLELHRELKVNGRDYNVGCPMGLPNSWCFLSITHASICRVVDPGGSWYIRGDDLIAYWTEGMWSLYRWLCDAVGFKLNIPKSFIAEKRGCFCEELYELDADALVLRPSCPVRWVSSTDSPDGSNFILSVASFATEAINRGFDSKRLHRTMDFAFGPVLSRARSLGIRPELPVAFGGLGYPPVDGTVHLRGNTHKKIDSIATGAQSVRPPMLNVTAGRFTKALNKYLSKVTFRVNDSIPCYHIDYACVNERERCYSMDTLEGNFAKRSVPIGTVLSRSAKSWSRVRPSGRPHQALRTVEGVDRSYTLNTVYELARKLYPAHESLLGHLKHETTASCSRQPSHTGIGALEPEPRGNPKQ